MGPNPVIVLIKGRHLDTDKHTERKPRQGEGRGRGDASTSPFCQWRPKLPTQRQKFGEAPGTGGPHGPQKEAALPTP